MGTPAWLGSVWRLLFSSGATGSHTCYSSGPARACNVLTWMFGLSSLFGSDRCYRQVVAPVLTSLLTLLRRNRLDAVAAGIARSGRPEGLRHRWARDSQPGVTAMLLFAAVILALPSLQASLANAHEHTLPDRRNELATWADTTLATRQILCHQSANHKTLDRELGWLCRLRPQFDICRRAHSLGRTFAGGMARR